MKLKTLLSFDLVITFQWIKYRKALCTKMFLTGLLRAVKKLETAVENIIGSILFNCTLARNCNWSKRLQALIDSVAQNLEQHVIILSTNVLGRQCVLPVTAAAAAAKSLQSCSTLCDPIDGSPPGSPVPGILQARTLEWVAISFSNAWKWKWSCSVMSDSSRPHGLQPTRLLRPWDFPGKSTGVGCHCLLRYQSLAKGKRVFVCIRYKTYRNLS